jgi:VWFA-related protein
MRKSLFICFALVVLITSAQGQSANEILAKAASVYATCESYSDEGSANVTAPAGAGRRTYFHTSFLRTAGFRFDFWFNSKASPMPPSVVWKSGDVVRTQGLSGALGVQNVRLDTALARMAALSGGGSMNIPQMLLPEEFRSNQLFSLVAEPRLAGEDKIDGHKAFRIEGTVQGFPVTFWIDKTQYVVLKSYRKVAVALREEEITIQYKPRLNVKIPPEDLTFPQSINQVNADIVTSRLRPTVSALPALPPRLRNFGSSLASARVAGGKSQNTSTDEDVVRVDTDLAVCAVLVLDPQGKIVKGLTASDFIVKEDEREQEVAMLSLGDNKDLPRSIVLIIDYSGSQLPYIRTSIESAKMLVDKLNPKDRMAVVTDDIRLLVDFTGDKQLLKGQLEGLKTSALAGMIGSSDQYDALMATLNELFDNEDTRPIIIFQTDGDQLESLKGELGADPYALSRKYRFADLLTATEKTRATVYSVISGVKFLNVSADELPKRARIHWEDRQHANMEMLRARNLPTPKDSFINQPDEFFSRLGQTWLRRQTALMNVAKFTGTLPEFLEEPGQADEIYNRILNDIDRRYVIGYYPTNRAHDGKRRKVSVEVKGHPEYTVWGQKSYFAREEK